MPLVAQQLLELLVGERLFTTLGRDLDGVVVDRDHDLVAHRQIFGHAAAGVGELEPEDIPLEE